MADIPISGPADRRPAACPSEVSPPPDIARDADPSLTRLFECLPATVWMTDTRMALTFAAGALLRRLHLDPARLLGRTLADLLFDGRHDHAFIHAHKKALGGQAASVRFEWGGHIYHACVSPLRGADDRVVGTVGIQQQIGRTPDQDDTWLESDVLEAERRQP